jgi:hypothetical protein
MRYLKRQTIRNFRIVLKKRAIKNQGNPGLFLFQKLWYATSNLKDIVSGKVH